MNLEFPLTPEKIREGMNEIISEIRKETNWDLVRSLSDITITVGDAPEYFESFGVVRTANEMVFGSWLNNVEPLFYKKSLWEFLIIRETISLFLSEDILFKEISQLTNYFLNFTSLSYIQSIVKDQPHEANLSEVKIRLLYPPSSSSIEETNQLTKIDSLLTTILTQNISFKLILNTFLFFIEDIPLEELDYNEIIYDFTRYIAVDPLHIAAPLQVNKTTASIISELSKSGYSTSFSDIAKKIGVDASIISRSLLKIATRYKSKWFIERNWKKMGLHSYLLIIKIDKQNEEIAQKILDELSKSNYIRRVYRGENSSALFIYSSIECPHIFIENFSIKMEKHLKKDEIISLETKLIRNKAYRTTIIDKDFIPNVNNFKELISNKKNLSVLELWNFNNFSEKTPTVFSEKDKNLLRFIAILMYDSIVGHGVFGVQVKELNKFLADNKIDSGNISDSISFFKKFQTEAFIKNLIDFRISISLSNLLPANYLVLKIKVNSNDLTEEIINKISIFSWMLIQFTSDSIIVLILGLDYHNPIVEVIKKNLSNYNVDIEFFSMNNVINKYVPFDKLYNFKTKKWLLD
ncbi:MAG TPA: hypothetical protein VMX55_12005 [candidate division Zixibacteria bacterium]|nr:hypothetical protein [candidate division Zixibacteria bacterium]